MNLIEVGVFACVLLWGVAAVLIAATLKVHWAFDALAFVVAAALSLGFFSMALRIHGVASDSLKRRSMEGGNVRSATVSLNAGLFLTIVMWTFCPVFLIRHFAPHRRSECPPSPCAAKH